MSSLSLCLVLALGSNDEKSLVPPGADAPPGRGLAAQFTWADVDGDGRLELGALDGDGKLRLLAPAGGDRFEDATERLGLAGVEDAALVLWTDYDADRRIDLFVGARAGRSRLFRNAGGLLEDWSAAAGLELEGAVQSATWLDHDGDGRLDLAVVTAEGSALRMSLFRGLEGGFFERMELAGLAGTGLAFPTGSALAPEGSSQSSDADERASGGGPAPRALRVDRAPTLECGLIAEEVADVFPELVVFDETGAPFTVKYHLLSAMLLNELQRLSEAHRHELAELRERLAALEERVPAVAR